MEANFTDVLFPGTVSTVANPVPSWAFFTTPRLGCVILTACPWWSIEWILLPPSSLAPDGISILHWPCLANTAPYRHTNEELIHTRWREPWYPWFLRKASMSSSCFPFPEHAQWLHAFDSVLAPLLHFYRSTIANNPFSFYCLIILCVFQTPHLIDRLCNETMLTWFSFLKQLF